jgi:RNA polymerase sigma-70 factor (ECF subfamily)
VEVNGKFSARALEDLDLVAKAREGDQVAFDKLMTRYRESIFFMVLKMVHNRDDADDLTIEAFGKAFNRLSQYTPNFAFSTWLFKIATNNCIDFIRKKKNNATVSIDKPFENDEGGEVSLDIKAPSLDPEENFIKKQKSLLMREVVEKLKPKYRNLVEMRYFDELSYEEISAKLDLPLGTVKAQLFRARDLLYNILKSSQSGL